MHGFQKVVVEIPFRHRSRENGIDPTVWAQGFVRGAYPFFNRLAFEGRDAEKTPTYFIARVIRRIQTSRYTMGTTELAGRNRAVERDTLAHEHEEALERSASQAGSRTGDEPDDDKSDGFRVNARFEVLLVDESTEVLT